MRPYGRQNFIEYGEIGTVTAHGDDGTFRMALDDEQPYWREMWGRGSSPAAHAGMVHEKLTPNEVNSLAGTYRENAKRFRAIARTFSDAAARETGPRGSEND